jgi:hypothetical protein
MLTISCDYFFPFSRFHPNHELQLKIILQHVFTEMTTRKRPKIQKPSYQKSAPIAEGSVTEQQTFSGRSAWQGCRWAWTRQRAAARPSRSSRRQGWPASSAAASPCPLPPPANHTNKLEWTRHPRRAHLYRSKKDTLRPLGIMAYRELLGIGPGHLSELLDGDMYNL